VCPRRADGKFRDWRGRVEKRRIEVAEGSIGVWKREATCKSITEILSSSSFWFSDLLGGYVSACIDFALERALSFLFMTEYLFAFHFGVFMVTVKGRDDHV